MYAALLDPEIREGYRQRGNDPDRLLDRCIELDNAVIRGPSGDHVRDPPLPGEQSEQVLRERWVRPDRGAGFKRTRFGRFLLEYDDERSGGFAPLQHVPDDRTVVLGLVTTKKPGLEAKETLIERIKEASRYIPLGARR
ncbi:MAG: hypothetical protein U0232_11130 [Thermomicrobiales bacterium]